MSLYQQYVNGSLDEVFRSFEIEGSFLEPFGVSEGVQVTVTTCHEHTYKVHTLWLTGKIYKT